MAENRSVDKQTASGLKSPNTLNSTYSPSHSKRNMTLELPPVPESYHEFVWRLDERTTKGVRLVGSWDDWQWESPMQLVEGCFRVLKALPPGTYEYKYIVNGDWQVDERLPVNKSTSGHVNNVLTVKAPKLIEGTPGHVLEQEPLIPCTAGSSSASFLNFGKVGHFPPDFVPPNTPVGWHLPEDLQHISASPPLFPLIFEARTTSPEVRQSTQTLQSAVRWHFAPSDLSGIKNLVCYIDLPEVQFIDALVFEFGLLRPWRGNWSENEMDHLYSLSLCYHSNSGWIDYMRHYPIVHLLASSQDTSTATSAPKSDPSNKDSAPSRSRRCSVQVGIRAQKLCLVLHEDPEQMQQKALASPAISTPTASAPHPPSGSSSSSSISSSSGFSESAESFSSDGPELPLRRIAEPISTPWRKQFKFTGESFDQSGLLYWLGTNEGREAHWENPALTGKVGLEISHSKMTNSTMSKANILARQTVEPTFWGGTSPTFFTIDLGSYYRFSPSYYTIRHGHSSPNSFISDWSFQGSLDGHDWVTLHSQEEPPFTHGFDIRSFAVPQLPEYFRYFRIIMKGNYSMIGHTQAMAQIWAANEAVKVAKAQRSERVKHALSSTPSSDALAHQQSASHSAASMDLAQKLTKPDVGAPFLCIAGFEMYGELSTVQQKPSSNLLTSMGLSLRSLTPVESEDKPLYFKHVSDFDTHGILYYLATNAGADPYINPSESGLVQVTLSHPSVYTPSMSKHNIIAHNTQKGNTFWGGSSPQWFTVDLRSKRVRPTAYTLRHGFGAANSFLRDWELSASHDAQSWVILHSGTTTPFNKGFDTDTWELAPSKGDEPFRYFRVLQRGNYYMGPDSEGAPYMCIAGFELYGELTTSAVPLPVDDNAPTASSLETPEVSTKPFDDQIPLDFVGVQMRRMRRQAMLANADFHNRLLTLLTSNATTVTQRIQCLELLIDVLSKSLVPLSSIQANLELRAFFRHCLLPSAKIFSFREVLAVSRSSTGSGSQGSSPLSSRTPTPPTPTAPAATTGDASSPSKESLLKLSKLALHFLGDVLLVPRPSDTPSSHSSTGQTHRDTLALEVLELLLSIISNYDSAFDSPHTVEVVLELLPAVWKQDAARSHSVCTTTLGALSDLLSDNRSAYYNILRTHYKIFDLVLERRLFFYTRLEASVLQSFHSEDPLSLGEQTSAQLERTLFQAREKFEQARYSLCTLLDDICSSSKPYSTFTSQVNTLSAECMRYQTLIGAVISRFTDPSLKRLVETSTPVSNLSKWEYLCEKLLKSINAQCGYRAAKKVGKSSKPGRPKKQSMVHPFSHSIEYLMKIFSTLCVYASPSVRAQAIRFLAPELGTYNSFPKMILASLFSKNNVHDLRNLFDKEKVFKSVVEMLSGKMRYHFSDQLFELIAHECSKPLASNLESSSKDTADPEILLWTVLLLSHLTETNNEAPHAGSTCRACNSSPIRGTRYRCANCLDYDICEQCESDPTRLHDAGHVFVKIDAPLPLQPSLSRAAANHPRETLLPSVLYDHAYESLSTWTDSSAVHMGVSCNSCGTSNIVGPRFKCCQCENFNICEACDQRGAWRDHLPMHLPLKIYHPLPQSVSSKALIPVLLHRGFYPSQEQDYPPAAQKKAFNPALPFADEPSSPAMTTERAEESEEIESEPEPVVEHHHVRAATEHVGSLRNPVASRRVPITSHGMLLSVSDYLEGPSATTAWASPVPMIIGPRDSEASAIPRMSPREGSMVQSAFIERTAPKQAALPPSRKMSLDTKSAKPNLTSTLKPTPGILKHSRTEDSLEKRMRQSRTDEEQRLLKKETILAQKRRQTLLALELLSRAIRIRPASSDLISLTCRITVELAKQQNATEFLQDLVSIVADDEFMEAACALDPVIQSTILNLMEEVLSTDTFLGHGVQEVHIALRAAVDKLEAFLIGLLLHSVHATHPSSTDALIFVETHALVLKLLLGTSSRSSFYRNAARDEPEPPRSASVTMTAVTPISYTVVSMSPVNTHFKKSGSSDKLAASSKVLGPPSPDSRPIPVIPKISLPPSAQMMIKAPQAPQPSTAREREHDRPPHHHVRPAATVDSLAEPLLTILCSLPLATFAEAQHWTLLLKLIGSATPTSVALCSHRFISAFRTTLICTAPYHKIVQAEMSSILYALSDEEDTFSAISVQLFETLMRETALRLVGPTPATEKPSQLYVTCIAILEKSAHLSNTSLWSGYPTFAAETARFLMAVSSSLGRQPRASPSYSLALSHVAMDLLTCFMAQPACMAHAKSDTVALLLRKGKSNHPTNEATCDIPIGAIASNSLTPEEESSIPIAVFLIRLLAHSDSFTDASKPEWNQFDDDLIKFLLHLTEGAEQSALALANVVFDEVTSPFLTTDSSRTKLVQRLLLPLLTHGEKVIERFASGEKVLERLLKSAAISEPTSARLPSSFTRAIALDDSSYLGMAHDYGAKYARKGRQISTTSVLPTIDGYDNLGTLIRLVDPQDPPFADMIRASALLGGEKGQLSVQIAPSRPLPSNLPESWKLEIEDDAEDFTIIFEFQAPVLLHEVRLTFNTSSKILPPSDVALEQGVSVSLLLPSVVSRSERKASKSSTGPTEEWAISTDSREFIRFLRLSLFGTASSTLDLSQILVLGHISSDSFVAPVMDARYTNSVSLTRQTALASESYLPIESSLAITKLILKKSDKFANAIANNGKASDLLMRLLGPCNLSAASSRDFDEVLCALIRHRPSLADQVLRRAISGDLLFRNVRITQAIIFAPDSSNPDSVANRLHVVFETALKVWNDSERDGSATSSYARLLPFIALVGLIFQQSMHVWEPGSSAGSIPLDFVRMLVCMSVSTEERIRSLSTSVLAALCRSNPAFFPISLQHAISDAIISKTPPQRVWKMLGTLTLTAPQSATALLEAKMLDSYIQTLVSLANMDLESAGEPSTVAIIRDVVLTQSLPLFTLLAHSPHMQTLLGPFILESTMALLRVSRPGTQLHDRLLELCDALTAHHPSNTSLMASLYSKDYLSSLSTAEGQEDSSFADTQGVSALRILYHLAAVQPMVCWSLSAIDGENAVSIGEPGADERLASELRISTHQQFSSLERIDMPKLEAFRANKCLKIDEMAKTVTNITQTSGWRTAVCANSLTGSSVYYWEITLTKLTEAGNAIIGVCEADHELSGWIGQTPAYLGWSFHGSAGSAKAYTYHAGSFNASYGRPMKQGDVVGVLVDLVQGELSFFINGQSLGVAFTNLTRQTLAPAVSLIEAGDSVCFSSPIYVLHTDSLLHGNHLIAKRLDPSDPRLALRQDSGSFGFIESPAFDSLPELRAFHSLLPEQVLSKKSAHPTFLRPLFESPTCTTFKSIKSSILASVPDSELRKRSRVTLGLLKSRKGTETDLERFEVLGDDDDFGEVWRRIKPSSRDCVLDLSFQLELKEDTEEDEDYDDFAEDYESSESSYPPSSPKGRRSSLRAFSPMAPILSSLQDIGTLDTALSLALRAISRLQFDSNAALVLPHASAPHGFIPVTSMNSNSLLSPAYRDIQLLVLTAPGMRNNFNALFKSTLVGDSPKTVLAKAESSSSGISSEKPHKDTAKSSSRSTTSNNADTDSSTSKADLKMPHVRVLPIGAWISFITLLRPLLAVDGYFALFRQNADCVTLLLQILDDCQLKRDAKHQVRRLNGFDSGLRSQASKPIWSNPTQILFEVLQECMESSISMPKDEQRASKAVALRNAIATGPILSTVLGVLSDASGLPPLDPTHKSFKKFVKSAEVRRGLAEKLANVPKRSNEPSSSSSQPISGATSQVEDNSKKTSWAKGTGYGSVSEDSGQKKQMAQDGNDYTSSTTEVVPLLSFLTSFLRIFPSRSIDRPLGSPDLSPRADLNDTQPPLCSEAYEILLSSCLVPLLDSLLRNDSLLDMGKQHKKYEAAFELTALFLSHPTLMSHFDEPFSANSKSTLRSSLASLNNVISAAQKKLTNRFRNPAQREASPAILAPTAHSTRHGSMLLPSPSPSPSPSVGGAKSSLHSSGRHSRTGIVSTQPARRRRNSSFHGGSRPGSRTGSMGPNLRKSGGVNAHGSRSGSSISTEESSAMEEQARLISWVFSLESLAVQRVDSMPKKESAPVPTEAAPTATTSAPTVEPSKESFEQQLNEYIEALGPLQFDEMEMCEDDDYVHHYYRQQLAEDQQSSAAKMKWLTHEIGSLAVGLPLHLTSSVFLRVDQSRLDCMKVAITGPSGTPYDSGVFIFDLYCPPDYPRVPPLINLQTTGLGSVRFNPNLYNNGKVCLSLLGTWPGGADEMWRENESTLLQVFVSIQSLIFIDEPYFNEPGFEAKLGTRAGKIDSDLYNEMIRAATLRWAILEHLKSPPLGFEALTAEHFKYRRVEIIRTCRSWLKDAKGSPTSGYEEKLTKLVNEIRPLLQALEPFEEDLAELNFQETPSKPAETLFENGESFLASNPSMKDQSPPDSP